MNLNSSKSNIIPKFNYRDLIIFLVPILIFAIYLFVYKPGVLTIASYSEFHQIATNKFTTAYPILYTLIETICLKNFNSISIIGAFQILIFSIMWMVICKYHRNDLSKSSNEFVLQFIVTLIICLIPINAVYSITLSSNVLFSYSLMFLCFLIKIIVDKNGQIDNKLIIILALTLAIISGLNNYGIYIALISLITIIYYLSKKNTSQNIFINLIGITIICILLMGSLSLIYEVKENTYDAYTQNVNIPTNDSFEEGINLESAKNQFFSSTKYKPKEVYENAASQNLKTDKYSLLDSFVNLFRENFVLDSLFNNPILYMIFSIVLLGFIYVITKSQDLLLIYVPNILNIIIVFTTGENNLYSNLLVFYLIVVIFISIYFNLDSYINGSRYIASTTVKQLESSTIDIRKENYIEDYYTDFNSEVDPDLIDEVLKEMGKK